MTYELVTTLRVVRPPTSTRGLTSLMTTFMAFAQRRILLCSASPFAARWASSALKGNLPVGTDKLRSRVVEVPIRPAADGAALLGTH